MDYVNSVGELVGKTPLLKLNNMGIPEQFNVFAKLEIFNPGGSIKDRIGFQIIKDAEEQGLIREGTVIIEPTAGNTGIGLALAALIKGYQVKLVVPEKFSVEKQILMRALGAEIINTPEALGIQGAIKRAYELAEENEDAYIPNQFTNQSNPKAHYLTTGPEIYEQLEGKIDIFVAGVGSGGTFTGVMQYFKEKNPDIKGVVVEPYGSIIGGGEKGCYQVEGIGNSFIPETLDMSLIDEVEKVTDEESFFYVKELARKEGLTVGSSSGAAMAGVFHQIEKLKGSGDGPINIVTIFPDRSDRYFSKSIYG
ncbi:cysteine synthase [Anoxybacter fermentans]|uniref:Cysteine synthase n=1 Tax=Anoxybacter fermentans TaxID=1323375 RepID=A0A3S9T1X7_9FIRM|nr:cysteine synthase family protein [Anoxybacter fermentans]AZR74517.1 cysteine synthase [Anoxybacter fermentans]